MNAALYVRVGELDLAEGSESREDIKTLESRGVTTSEHSNSDDRRSSVMYNGPLRRKYSPCAPGSLIWGIPYLKLKSGNTSGGP